LNLKAGWCLLPFLWACATPQDDLRERHQRHRFPKTGVYIEEPDGLDQGRPFQTLGWVRSKATWSTLDQDPHAPHLCRNYFNQASKRLLEEAKKAGADAVIKVRSVVLLLDGRLEYHPGPECSDDGSEGEVLLQGIAIKFKTLPTPSPTPRPN
jgi:hypothetical protein